MAASWYVVNTIAGYENTVERNLKERIAQSPHGELIEEILIPTEEVVEQKSEDAKPKKVKKRKYPGYVFVRVDLTDEAWHLIAGTQRVTGFLGAKPGRKPPLVPEREIRRMLGLDKEEREAQEAARRAEAPVVQFDIGERVRITGGAFAGFEGEVRDQDVQHHKLGVTVTMFGRETRVEVDHTEVEKLSAE